MNIITLLHQCTATKTIDEFTKQLEIDEKIMKIKTRMNCVNQTLNQQSFIHLKAICRFIKPITIGYNFEINKYNPYDNYSGKDNGGCIEMDALK